MPKITFNDAILVRSSQLNVQLLMDDILVRSNQLRMYKSTHPKIIGRLFWLEVAN